MANKSKAENAAALLSAGISRKSYSKAEFCALHGISIGLYDKLKKRALGPRETNLLDRITITDDAEADCLRQREATSAETNTAA